MIFVFDHVLSLERGCFLGKGAHRGEEGAFSYCRTCENHLHVAFRHSPNPKSQCRI